LRDRLFDRGEYDGFLAYDGDTPIAWCQVGPRDRLSKLTRQLELTADTDTWAITCVLVAPAYRRRGLLRELLESVIESLRRSGVARLEAYPRRGAREALDLWTGPEQVFIETGFRVTRDDPVRPVYCLELNAGTERINS
jgi:GNAT superfamily N-acetyltransferase